MNAVSSLLGREGFLPHGYCFTWDPGLLWTMVVSDVLIASAYFSIPVALVYFIRRRSDVSLSKVVWLFSAFISACGATHVLDVWTVWEPVYGLHAATKVLTASVSVATAVVLWLLMPSALRIPSVSALNRVIADNAREIAERRRVEDSLLDAQNSLAIALSSFDAGLISIDRDGRITHMNAVAERVTGWRHDEALGACLWDVWQREGRPQTYLARNPVELALEGSLGPSEVHRVVAISRQGIRTPLELSGSPARAPDGTVRGLVLVFRDMTRLDRAETESRQLAAIVESSNEAIIGKNLQGTITSWNRAAERLFGYPADDVIGQSIDRLFPPEVVAREHAYLASLEDGNVIAPFETLGLHRDGHVLHVEATISRIENAQGQLVGISRLVRDVSAQRKEQEARATVLRLATENQQIVEASRLKSAFLANMSHELRTPLNAIIGFSDLLKAGIVPPGAQRYEEFVGYISSSGRHLLRVINDILDLSKVEAGKLELSPEWLDVPELTSDASALLRTEASRKGVSLGVEVDDRLTRVWLDGGRLKQVIYNYLSNAIKFTPQGGSVMLRACILDAHTWRLEVEDTGIGIADKDLPRLFIDFHQLDTGYTKQHQGTGLGLALTKRLVEAQGGHVGVHSRLGHGSVFFAILPRHWPSAESPFGNAAVND